MQICQRYILWLQLLILCQVLKNKYFENFFFFKNFKISNSPINREINENKTIAIFIALIEILPPEPFFLLHLFHQSL